MTSKQPSIVEITVTPSLADERRYYLEMNDYQLKFFTAVLKLLSIGLYDTRREAPSPDPYDTLPLDTESFQVYTQSVGNDDSA